MDTMTGRAARPRLDGPPPLPQGHEIAPGYQVIEHLRRGADLDSYDAWSHSRYCRCVIKTPRPDRYAHTGVRNKLIREGRLLLSLTHPHLVRAYDLLSDWTRPPVLVLETLGGDTLAHLLAQSHHLGGAELGFLGQHLCSAVRYLHARGYLHLDVKPSNIIADGGRAKLIDLSLARRPGRCHGGLGTAGYQAPEQMRGGELVRATDVWGIGRVLHEAAGDHRLPTTVAAAIERCLDDDPARRPSLAALNVTLAELTGQPEPGPPAWRAATRWRPRAAPRRR